MAAKALKALLGRLRAAYPGTYLPEERWIPLVSEWCDELGHYSDNVVVGAFAPVRRTHPDKFPTMTQLENILRSLSKASGGRQRQMDLPPPPADREAAVEDFQLSCDQVLALGLGDRITADNRHLVEGVVAVMGPLFGFTAASMHGDPKSKDPDERFNYCQAHTNAFMRAKMSPGQVVRGLRGVPEQFPSKYPSQAQLEMLIRGDLPENLSEAAP